MGLKAGGRNNTGVERPCPACCSHGQTGAALWLTFLSLARRGYSLEAFSIILVQGRLDNYMSIQEAGVQTLEVPEQAV